MKIGRRIKRQNRQVLLEEEGFWNLNPQITLKSPQPRERPWKLEEKEATVEKLAISDYDLRLPQEDISIALKNPNTKSKNAQTKNRNK